MKKFKFDVDPETDEYVVTMRFSCNKPRVNPYSEVDGDFGTYSEICGIINHEKEEFGFAYTIDMDYKGKSDQWTKTFVDMDMFGIESTDFIRLCEEWSIPYVIE